METTSLITLTVTEHLTADHLLAVARQTGLSALGVQPRAGWPYKVLLGSLVDVKAPGVQDRLVAMLREGELQLTSVDSPKAFVPCDRWNVYLSGRFWHLCSWFDAVEFPGELLLNTGIGTRRPVITL